IPPKLPISVSVRSLKVLRAYSRIFATARLALSIETPASAYEIGLRINASLLDDLIDERIGRSPGRFCDAEFAKQNTFEFVFCLNAGSGPPFAVGKYQFF